MEIFLVFFVLFIIILTVLYIKMRKNKVLKKIEEEPVKENNKILKDVSLPSNFDIDEFEDIASNLYIDLQQYFMDLDLDNLSNILTNNMFEQYKKQIEHLVKYNKRAMRENIEVFDFKISKYEMDDFETVIVSLGVHEDKYTKYLDNESNIRKISYENYYEIKFIYDNCWKVDYMNMLYSHSIKKDRN